jgi:hypothetical protein
LLQRSKKLFDDFLWMVFLDKDFLWIGFYG